MNGSGMQAPHPHHPLIVPFVHELYLVFQKLSSQHSESDIERLSTYQAAPVGEICHHYQLRVSSAHLGSLVPQILRISKLWNFTYKPT